MQISLDIGKNANYNYTINQGSRVNQLHELQNLRKQHKMSLVDLANLLGVSQWTIIRWENGETAPNARQIVRLAEIFKVTPNDLLIDD